jgi:hypothetical protein
MHVNLLCACWHHEAMRGSSSLASCRLLTSSLFPCLGSTDAPCSRLGDPALLPQYSCPIHRVRAPSLAGIRNNYTAGLAYQVSTKPWGYTAELTSTKPRGYTAGAEAYQMSTKTWAILQGWLIKCRLNHEAILQELINAKSMGLFCRS